MFTKNLVGNDRLLNYQTLLETMPAFVDRDEALITVLSNVSALINVYMDSINWVGFYLLDKNILYLGPFQGLPACTKIPLGKGVCGTSASQKKSLIVDDVHTFEGHIACDQNSQSEIVVPLIKDGEVFGVIDIDSPLKHRFGNDELDVLEKVAALLVDIL